MCALQEVASTFKYRRPNVPWGGYVKIVCSGIKENISLLLEPTCYRAGRTTNGYPSIQNVRGRTKWMGIGVQAWKKKQLEFFRRRSYGLRRRNNGQHAALGQATDGYSRGYGRCQSWR